MSDGSTQEFPLFPLNIVALPEEAVPLHIFEERYKTMVRMCLDEEREFGILWLSDDGLKDIGCACEIEQVEELEEGRMNLVVRGTRPFRVLERQGHLPYPAGIVEFVEDRDEPIEDETQRAARDAYGELVEHATDHRPEPTDLAEMTAYGMAATVDFGKEAKQGLLDLRTENARLKLVTRLFRAAIKRLELADRAQERARSNGKVRLG